MFVVSCSILQNKTISNQLFTTQVGLAWKNPGEGIRQPLGLQMLLSYNFLLLLVQDCGRMKKGAHTLAEFQLNLNSTYCISVRFSLHGWARNLVVPLVR